MLPGQQILTPQRKCKKIHHTKKVQDDEITFHHFSHFFHAVQTRKGMADSDKEDKVHKYGAFVAAFMSWEDSIPYIATHRFENNQVLAITIEDLVKWFCLSIYGVEEPGPEDKPTVGRSSLILFSNKTISYFMPTNWSRGIQDQKKGILQDPSRWMCW